MTDPAPERTGERIGPYRLETRLGAGGMGEVFLAYDERLDRRVAVKLIRPESASDGAARQRFRREARAAAGLSHPSVVQIYDILEWGEGDAIVMELVDGASLSTLSSGASGASAPDLPAVLRLAREVAEGLPPPTPAASSTVTSRPRTSWSPPAGMPRSWTSASPSGSAPRPAKRPRRSPPSPATTR